MSVTEQDILTRAHELAGEFEITRGAYARDEKGEACATEEGVQFCSMGLITRAALDLGMSHREIAFCDDGSAPLHTPYGKAVRMFRDVVGITEGQAVTEWNDNYASSDEIRAAFAKAAGRETVARAVADVDLRELQLARA